MSDARPDTPHGLEAAEPAMEKPVPVDEVADRRVELLAQCTEDKRLARASREAERVQFLIDGPDLWIASVSSYNVVLDLPASRLQHGCRDFQGQVQERRLCKHVAGLLLAIDEEVAIEVLRRIVDPAGDWHLEAMVARGFGKS